MRTLQILALLFTALALVPAGAHFFEFPNKISLSRESYFTVQNLYRGWQFFGIAIIGAVLLNGALAFMLRDGGTKFAYALAACCLLLASLAIFFIWTFPVNQATGDWSRIPADWQQLRRQWEYSHLANAIVVFASLACVALSIVAER